MSVQTTYSLKLEIGYPGLRYDLNDGVVISRAVEGAAGFNFGLAVSRGTDKTTQAVVGGDDFLGITLRSLDKEGALDGNSSIKWNETESVAILRKGSVYATCTNGCTAGDAVKYITATGLLHSGVAGVGEIQIDGAEWDTTTVAGSVGVLVLHNLSTTTGS